MPAAVWAIKTFRPYLLGSKFDVVTNHSPLQWLISNLELTGKHARWALALQEYDFTIKHWGSPIRTQTSSHSTHKPQVLT
jgi:hypothetical protein